MAPYSVGSFQVVVLDGEDVATLTEAERAVVGLALVGLSNRDIAARRGCAARTVANQLAAAYKKLGVGTRSELVARFVK